MMGTKQLYSDGSSFSSIEKFIHLKNKSYVVPSVIILVKYKIDDSSDEYIRT